MRLAVSLLCMWVALPSLKTLLLNRLSRGFPADNPRGVCTDLPTLLNCIRMTIKVSHHDDRKGYSLQALTNVWGRLTGMLWPVMGAVLEIT